VLSVLGQSLRGDFSIEQVQRSGMTDVTRIAIENLSLRIGTSTTDFLTVSNGQGLFLLTDAGVAGSLSGTATLNVPGVVFSSQLALEINNSNQAVSETFEIRGESKTLTLSAGPYFRLQGSGLTLMVAGQELTGDFTFTRRVVNGQVEIEATVANGGLKLGIGGSDFVVVSNASGTL
jgi:hypothetical protein